MEGHAFFNFIKKYKNSYGSHDFQYQSLDGAVVTSRVKKIPILLYLHMDNLEFSNDFLLIIENEHSIFENFTVLLWDVGEKEINKHLIESCKKHLKFNIIYDYISNQTSAVFVISVEEEYMKLNQLYDEINDNNFISNLMNSSDNNMIANCCLKIRYRKKRGAIALDADCNVISDMEKKKFKSVSTNPIGEVSQDFKNLFKSIFTNCSVKFEQSIEAAKTSALRDEVPLILYYFNRADTFYDMYYSLLGNENINDLFNNFRIYVYDKDNANENENTRFLRNNGDLNSKNILESVFIEGRSCVLIYSTINGNLNLSNVCKDLDNEDDILNALYNIYIDNEECKMKNNKIIENISVIHAINDIDCPLFECNTLKKSIELTLTCDPLYKRKIFVLYYHNRNDIFWSCFQKFLESLDLKTKYMIEHLFYLLPWDVTNSRYHAALKSSISMQFDYQEMKDRINRSEGSLYFFISSNDKYHLFNTLKGEVDIEIFQTIFKELAMSFVAANAITALDEYTACNNSAAHFTINKCVKPMCKVITEHCLCFPLKSRKMLLVHCYNKTEKVSMELVKALQSNSNLKNALKECVFVSWDITNSDVNKNLQLVVHRHFGLKVMENLIHDKKTAIYIFMPIQESLTLASCILGSTSISKICSTLENISKNFVNEKNIEDELPGNRKDNFGPTYVQQLMYDQLGNRDYDCFQLYKEEGKHIKGKVAFAYFGQPEAEQNNEAFYTAKQQQKIDQVYDKIVKKAKEFNAFPDDIVFTCIYNCLMPLPESKLKKLKKDPNYDPNLDFITLPVFVIRKCVDSPKHSACRIFIDSDLRVYNSWDDYLNDNKHSEGIFIVPLDGKYQGDTMGNVRVQYLLSPACGMGQAILKGFDIGTTVVGVGAGVVGAAALIPAIPVAPVILIGATVAGVGVGIYSLVRSTVHLVDRHIHGESMSLANSGARGAYFNIIAGTLGFTGAGANFALAYFARSGADIGLIAKGAINGLTTVNILGSGAAVANSTYEVINDWVVNKEHPSTLTIIQLSSSILFFGHAVYNVKMAGTIIQEAQAQKISEINSSLRYNRQKKIFNKITKETIRINGVEKGQAEIISYIKNLNKPEEVFAVLTKANKAMNKSGVRFAIENGEVHFNGMEVNISEFGSLSKLQQGEYLLNMPEMSKPSVANIKSTQFNLKQIFSGFDVGNVQMLNIVEAFFKSGTLSVQLIAKTISCFSQYVQKKILDLVQKTMKCICLDIKLNKALIELVPQHKQILYVLRIIMDYFKNKTKNNNNDQQFDYIKIIEIGIIVACKSPEGIIKELIKHLTNRLAQKLYDKFVDNKNNVSTESDRKKNKCEICEGSYFS